MESSRTIEEWNNNCLIVYQACGNQFPDFWNEILESPANGSETEAAA
jgi:hypothetical protein